MSTAQSSLLGGIRFAFGCCHLHHTYRLRGFFGEVQKSGERFAFTTFTSLFSLFLVNLLSGIRLVRQNYNSFGLRMGKGCIVSMRFVRKPHAVEQLYKQRKIL